MNLLQFLLSILSKRNSFMTHIHFDNEEIKNEYWITQPININDIIEVKINILNRILRSIWKRPAVSFMSKFLENAKHVTKMSKGLQNQALMIFGSFGSIFTSNFWKGLVTLKVSRPRISFTHISSSVAPAQNLANSQGSVSKIRNKEAYFQN